MHRLVLAAWLAGLGVCAQVKPPPQTPSPQTPPPQTPPPQTAPPGPEAGTAPPSYDVDLGAVFGTPTLGFFPGLADFNVLEDVFIGVQGVDSQRGPPASSSAPPGRGARPTPAPQGKGPLPSLSGTPTPSTEAPKSEPTVSPALQSPQLPGSQFGDLQAYSGLHFPPSIGLAAGQGFPLHTDGFYTDFIPGHGLFGPGF